MVAIRPRHTRRRIPRAANRFADGERTGWKCEPAFRVDEHCGALRAKDLRLGRPIGSAIGEVQRILGDARCAVR
jgi:hypothetical protein